MPLDEGLQGIDEQELGERSLAAKAYGEEDPDLYIDYSHACIKESEDATQEKRFIWDECYKAYSSKVDYPDKQDWQAKVVTGDMYATVKQAMAVIRKSFRQPNWLRIDGVGEEDEILASFLKAALDIWFDKQHSNFPLIFSDSSELGFAIGQSHEIIPRWVDGTGLVFDKVPPWQIYRDPDAEPRNPWSGDYWTHVEWIDLWKVKGWGKQNDKFVRLDKVTSSESSWGNENQDKRARRKGQYHQRTPYRHAVRVVEQWGVILDKQGELLLDNARFMIAGDVLIRNPEASPFVKMRWPGSSFSPLPDLFSFDGHGIIESSLLLYLMSCNLMSLHVDDISWRVNKMRELDRMMLEDPTDVVLCPGKTILRGTNAPAGQPITREVYSSNPVNEVLATLQYWEQKQENSSFVSQYVEGLPGYRSQVTKGEVEIKTSQSMTIFDSMGEDIEEGAVNAVRAAIETIILNWTEYSDPPISRVLPNHPFAKIFAEMPIEARKELLKANCDIKIEGISAQIRDSDLIPKLQWLMEKAENPLWNRYFKGHPLVKKVVNTLGFREPDFLLNDQEAKIADDIQKMVDVARMIGGDSETQPGESPVVPKKKGGSA